MGIEQYDLFVIGTGTAGKKVAYACAEQGWSVAIADDREFGGTCANRGCDPKKVLVGITETMELCENLTGKGIVQPPEINWSDLQAFKETFVDAIPFTTERDLREAGITMYHQSPKFLDTNTLSVEGKTVKADKIVIATGLQPVELKIPGREHLKISDDFLNLSELPESMVFIGAGYIGMEFAHIAARCGVEVTMFESEDQILSGFDKDLSNYLQENSEQLGIKFQLSTTVEEVEHLRKNYRVKAVTKNGKKVEVKAEMVFNTAGRLPGLESLELEKGNVKFEKSGVTVNEYLQSPTNSAVYACGDVSASGSLPLTPLSSQEGRIVAKNLLEGNQYKAEFPPTPSVVFTQPQLSRVGLLEKEAKEQGYNVQVNFKNVPDWYNSKRLNQNCYAYKTIIDKDTGYILGAHLLSRDAAETINLFVLAMCGKLNCETLKGMIFTYPSWSSDIKSML